jgi:hypothetical protein
MIGALSILAVGLVIGVAIAWAPGAGPKNDQRSRVTLDDAVRVRDDGARDPTGDDSGLDRSQGDAVRRDVAIKSSSIIAELQKNIGSLIDFFETKFFGACFGGLVSVVTLQVAGANVRSTFALTLLIVLGYWLVIDKPR